MAHPPSQNGALKGPIPEWRTEDDMYMKCGIGHMTLAVSPTLRFGDTSRLISFSGRWMSVGAQMARRMAKVFHLPPEGAPSACCKHGPVTHE